MAKAPLAARDHYPGPGGPVAYGKNVFQAARIRIVDWITLSSVGPQHDMPQRHVVSFLRQREIRSHQPANLFASRIMSNRSAEANLLSSLSKVKLPAEPSNRVAFAQQESVPDLPVCFRGTPAVHQPQNSSPPAVGNLEQHGPVPLVHVFGFEEIQVRRKLDFSLRIARCFINIDDLPVVNVFRIDRKIDPPNDPLVSSSHSKRPPVLHIRPRKNLHPRNMRLGGGSQENEECQGPAETFA